MPSINAEFKEEQYTFQAKFGDVHYGVSATIEGVSAVSGDEAKAENIGTKTAAVIRFTLPRGEKGDTGEAGPGTGDMLASIYDPTRKASDIFAYADGQAAAAQAAAEAAAAEVLAAAVSQASGPIFVNSVEEMTDTGKVYVLDGYVWAWMTGGPEPLFTNRLPLAIDTDGTVYNDVGYANGKRINSAGSVVDQDGLYATGFIPVSAGDTLYLSGDVFIVTSNSNGNSYVYTASKQILAGFSSYGIKTADGYTPNGTFSVYNKFDVTLENDVLKKICIKDTVSNPAYIRLSTSGSLTDNAIITVNEEIAYSEGGFAWRNTGTPYAPASNQAQVDGLEANVDGLEANVDGLDSRVTALEEKTLSAVPACWASAVNEKAAAVNALQSAGGKDCFSFVWAADLHIPENYANSRTDSMGKLMAAMLDKCTLPFAVISGDTCTQDSSATKGGLLNYMKQIPVHLARLWGTDRLLVCPGNHDGCWGDSTCYYRKQLPPEEIWDMYFRPQALDVRRVFSEDGLYFYADVPAQKIRFILLNAHFAGTYSVDENGWAVNNRFATSCYGQDQLDWLADTALNMPAGYGAVIVTHVPPTQAMSGYTKDQALLIGIVTAYCNNAAYAGSVTDGVDGWTNSAVSVDFSGAQGEIIGVFAGHVHADSVDTISLPCPIITVTTSGGDVRDDPAPARTPNTDTETAFDVVTIDRRDRKIYFTRVGAGTDRVVGY